MATRSTIVHHLREGEPHDTSMELEGADVVGDVGRPQLQDRGHRVLLLAATLRTYRGRVMTFAEMERRLEALEKRVRVLEGAGDQLELFKKMVPSSPQTPHWVLPVFPYAVPAYPQPPSVVWC